MRSLLFVIFPASLDRDRFFLMKLCIILERFTRSNDFSNILITLGLIFLFVTDRLVCQNKSVNAGLLLDCWLNGVLSLPLICRSLSTKCLIKSKLSELLSVNKEFCFFDILSCVVESNLSCLCAMRQMLTSKAMAKRRLFWTLTFPLVIHKFYSDSCLSN